MKRTSKALGRALIARLTVCLVALSCASCAAMAARSACVDSNFVEGTGSFEACWRVQFKIAAAREAAAMAQYNAQMEEANRDRARKQKEFQERIDKIRSDHDQRMDRAREADQAAARKAEADRQQQAAANRAAYQKRQAEQQAAYQSRWDQWKAARQLKVCNGYKTPVTFMTWGYKGALYGGQPNQIRKNVVHAPRQVRLDPGACAVAYPSGLSRYPLRALATDGASWEGSGRVAHEGGGMFGGCFYVNGSGTFQFEPRGSFFRPAGKEFEVCNNYTPNAQYEEDFVSVAAVFQQRGVWVSKGRYVLRRGQCAKLPPLKDTPLYLSAVAPVRPGAGRWERASWGGGENFVVSNGWTTNYEVRDNVKRQGFRDLRPTNSFFEVALSSGNTYAFSRSSSTFSGGRLFPTSSSPNIVNTNIMK